MTSACWSCLQLANASVRRRRGECRPVRVGDLVTEGQHGVDTLDREPTWCRSRLLLGAIESKQRVSRHAKFRRGESFDRNAAVNTCVSIAPGSCPSGCAPGSAGLIPACCAHPSREAQPGTSARHCHYTPADDADVGEYVSSSSDGVPAGVELMGPGEGGRGHGPQAGLPTLRRRCRVRVALAVGRGSSGRRRDQRMRCRADPALLAIDRT
jgi:hypothetical protein